MARADLYPRVNLGGAIGLLTGRLVATGSPLVSWAFPNQAPARARLAQARASERGALASWDVAVLRALREVESALVAYDAEQRRNRTLVEADKEARLTARRAAAQEGRAAGAAQEGRSKGLRRGHLTADAATIFGTVDTLSGTTPGHMG